MLGVLLSLAGYTSFNLSAIQELSIQTGGYNAAPEETFAGQLKADPEKFLTTVGTLAADLSKLKGFDRLVIHAYAQYFNGLYGIDPDANDSDPTELFGPIASDAALPEAKLPDGTEGFVGKVTGTVTQLGRTAFALRVSKVKAATGSSANDADALKGEVIIVRAGADDLHKRWISTLSNDEEVSVEVDTKDRALRIVELSSTQRKAARKAD